MSEELLKEVLRGEYAKRNISINYCVSPLINLTKDQKRMMVEGSGQSIDQYRQINSSAGLAVNYYKILKELKLISDLKFEHKIAKPLDIPYGNYANLDVSYKRGDVLYFVESKFLESYCGANEPIKGSYLVPDNYPDALKGHVKDWLNKLFPENKDEDFKYYNVSQLYRHFLALYRYTHNSDGSLCKTEHLVLQSVTWRMTEKFMKNLKSRQAKAMNERNGALDKEAKKCECLFTQFIKDIKWENMEFETKHYNDEDMLNEISKSEHYKEFCQRYFIDEP